MQHIYGYYIGEGKQKTPTARDAGSRVGREIPRVQEDLGQNVQLPPFSPSLRVHTSIFSCSSVAESRRSSLVTLSTSPVSGVVVKWKAWIDLSDSLNTAELCLLRKFIMSSPRLLLSSKWKLFPSVTI